MLRDCNWTHAPYLAEEDADANAVRAVIMYMWIIIRGNMVVHCPIANAVPQTICTSRICVQ